MTIGTMISRKPVTVSPDDSLATVARLMAQANVGAVVIVRQKRPLGIVTDRDLALAVCHKGVLPTEMVHNVMTCPVETLSNKDGVYDATRRMMEHHVRRLPVVDSRGDLLGLISLDDLLLLLARELSNVTEGVMAETVVA